MKLRAAGHALLMMALLPLGNLAAAEKKPSQFQDLAPDHWAYGAVQGLVGRGIMEGFPDGTFKGRKVMTRFDFAQMLSRVIQAIDDKEKEGKSLASQDAVVLARLAKEFKDELGLLGVRTDTVEKRVKEIEERVKKMETNFPKVVVSGYYQGQMTYIFERKSTRQFDDKYNSEEKEFDPGLQPVDHEVYVRFTGKPFDERVETFVELLGKNYGQRDKVNYYNNVGQTQDPNAFDHVDDFLSDTVNEKQVTINKGHLKVNSKLMNFRYFAGEATTGMDDPVNLISQDTDIFNPYNGVELRGSGGAYAYFLTAMTEYKEKNPMDEAYSDDDYYKDVLGSRLTFKVPKEFSPDEISSSFNFAERVNDYKTRHNTNSVHGIDFAFKTKRVGDLVLTTEYLRSLDYHKNTQTKNNEGVRGSGFKIDGTFTRGAFTGTYKHYEYDKDFYARLSDPLTIDTGRDYDANPGKQESKWNYGRNEKWDYDGNYGEILTRFSGKYDFKDKILSLCKNLSLEVVAQIKDFKEDPFEPDDTDGYTGKKYSLQLLTDWNDSTSSRFYTEIKKDALKDEEGRQKNELELNLKVTSTLSSTAKAEFIRDPDRLDSGHGFKSRLGYFELASDLSPRLFGQLSLEHYSAWPEAPSESNQWQSEGKTTYKFTPNLSWTGSVRYRNYDRTFDNTKDYWMTVLVNELKSNFTNAFKGKAVHGRRLQTFKNTPEYSDVENIYGELIYTPTDVTTLELKFGFDYPKDSKFWFGSTQKKLFLQAKTDF